MPRRPTRSREAGLFKYCAHLWDRCDCPWLGRYKHVRYINLGEWGGVPSPLLKTRAKELLADAKIAITNGTFRKEGKQFEPKVLEERMLFREFLAKYRTYLVEERGIRYGGGNSLHEFIDRLEKDFGNAALGLMTSVGQWEGFLKGKSPATFNRYRAYTHAMFKWGMRPKVNLVLRNPLSEIERRQELVVKPHRLDDGGVGEQDLIDALLLAYPHVGDGKHNAQDALNAMRRKEMERRIVAALDTGLRKKEMANIQVKHINFKTWEITLPTSKGFTKTGKQETIYAMTDRLQAILLERQKLGSEAFVFGCEDGSYQHEWKRAWKRVFTKAGLSVGRGKFVWHSLRHEFISQIAEVTDNIQEVKELARHQNVETTMGYMKAKEERLRELLRKRGRA